MAALRRLVSVISDGRSKKKAGPSKVTGLLFLVAGRALAVSKVFRTARYTEGSADCCLADSGKFPYAQDRIPRESRSA